MRGPEDGGEELDLDDLARGRVDEPRLLAGGIKVSPRLNYVVADARAVAWVFPALGFPPANIRLLLDGEATRANIERALYREFARMGPGDRPPDDGRGGRDGIRL